MKSSLLYVLVASSFLCACAWLAPAYQRPSFDMPAAQNTDEKMATPLNANGWQAFQDPVLSDLIAEALANNDDLAVARARLAQAKAQYDYAFANRFPLLAVTGDATRSKMDFAKDTPLLSDKPSNLGFLGGLVSYELDLWGKQASTSQAAQANVLALSYSQDAAKISVAAATAQLYFSLLALDADGAALKQLVDTLAQTHALVQKQCDAGVADARLLHQAEAKEAEAQTARTQLLDQKEQAEGALALLLGRAPRLVMEGNARRGQTLETLSVPSLEPNDLSSTILERRPDIAAREQALIASHFAIGAARAAYFPTISLSALLGITSLDIDNLYKGAVRTWSMGGTLAGPLIDFGRTQSGVDMSLAENQEQLALYKNAVRTAFKETRDALSAQNSARAIDDQQKAKEKAAEENFRLAALRAKAGYASDLDSLAAEGALREAQIAATAAKLHRLNAAASLYKTLGGGWSP